MEVQVFGIRKDAATRKALRFFAERRVKVHFVDLDERAASLGELRRFAQKFGVKALVNGDSTLMDKLGLRYARYTDDRWLEKLEAEPRLLNIPLARFGQQLTVGLAEPAWKGWMERAK